MSFIPLDELKTREGVTMAPMIDFLFLMLAMFASFAVSRVILGETEIELVQATGEAAATSAQEHSVIYLSISAAGNYEWITEIKDHQMASPQEILTELASQQERGILPKDPDQTRVLIKVDKEAKWEAVLHLLLAIQGAGFTAYPIYEPAPIS